MDVFRRTHHLNDLGRVDQPVYDDVADVDSLRLEFPCEGLREGAEA